MHLRNGAGWKSAGTCYCKILQISQMSLSHLEEGNREAAFVSHTKATEFVHIHLVRTDII